MNNIKRLSVLNILTLSAGIALAAFASIGCSGCANIQEGHDSVVVRAEQTADGAFEIMDAFVLYEQNNRAVLQGWSPEIEKAANRIRREAPKAVESLRTATKVYKAARTPENKATLETWITLVAELKRIAMLHFAQAQVAKQ